jgi:4-carboxymuconolactone decarboxylase
MKMPQPPDTYKQFQDRHPDVGSAYEHLGAAAAEAGPLDRKSTHLVKLGIAIGMQHEGATHAHARKALAGGVTPDELRHAAILAMTTLGFPSMMAAYTWVEDIIEEHVAG